MAICLFNDAEVKSILPNLINTVLHWSPALSCDKLTEAEHVQAWNSVHMFTLTFWIYEVCIPNACSLIACTGLCCWKCSRSAWSASVLTCIIWLRTCLVHRSGSGSSNRGERSIAKGRTQQVRRCPYLNMSMFCSLCCCNEAADSETKGLFSLEPTEFILLQITFIYLYAHFEIDKTIIAHF